MLHHAVNVPEETHMAQLVYLVVANGLHLHLGPDVHQVVLRRRQSGNAGAGEADLGGGGKLVGKVRVACPFALCQNLNQVVLIVVIQVMDGVGIVPVDAEVHGGGLQSGKPADGIIGIGNALGVGIFGHTPDALDGRIGGYQLLHHIHIGTGGQHGNIDHFDAEILGNGKVAVVTGNRAEEFYLFQLAPGRAAHDPADHGAGHGIEHHVQTGIAVDDHLVGANLHHVGHQFLGFLNAVQHAVVPAVGAVFTGQVTFAVQHIHHAHGEVQLILTGLAAGHIQRQLSFLILRVFCLQGFFLLLQLFTGHFGIRFHSYLPDCFTNLQDSIPKLA